jgi:hypothetical protein
MFMTSRSIHIIIIIIIIIYVTDRSDVLTLMNGEILRVSLKAIDHENDFCLTNDEIKNLNLDCSQIKVLRQIGQIDKKDQLSKWLNWSNWSNHYEEVVFPCGRQAFWVRCTAIFLSLTSQSCDEERGRERIQFIDLPKRFHEPVSCHLNRA